MARSKRQKNLRRQEKRKVNKEIKVDSVKRPNNVSPVFDIGFLIKEEKFGLPLQNISLLADIFNKLKEFENMTIAEATSNGDSLVNYTPDKKKCLCRHVQKRIDNTPEYAIFEEDGIWRYRLSGKSRIYAFRVGVSLFKIVWVDLEHEIYPLER